MQKTVFIQDNTLFLNSFLDESMFAKTKFSLLLNEKGILVNTTDENYTFEEWQFSEITEKENTVFFAKENTEGTPLSFFTQKIKNHREEEDSKELEDAVEKIFTLCSVFLNAIKTNTNLPSNGPEGIIFSEDKIIFLPEKTLDRSLKNLGKTEYEKIQNAWRDSLATKTNALNFNLALYSYFALTGTLPFPAQEDSNSSKLNETEPNINDRNFIPIELCVNGISKKLSQAINVRLLGKNTKLPTFPIKELKKELEYKIKKTKRKNAIPETDFQKKKEDYVLKSQKKLKQKKVFRRNSLLYAFIAAAILFFTVAAISITKDYGKKPTVVSLSSKQVTEVFYKGIHTMDTDLMLASAKNCPQAQRYISQVPQLYVTGQMKSAYNFESGISTPENWFFFEPDTSKSYSHFVYGITNFSIDRENSALNIKIPQKKQKPRRILFTSDGKTRIEKSPDATHIVRYFLVHTVDNMFQIDQYTTEVSLKYIKDKWQITNLDQVSSTEVISPLTISLDLKKALEEFNGNEIKAVNSLRKKYYWLPTEESLILEKERLDAIGY